MPNEQALIDDAVSRRRNERPPPCWVLEWRRGAGRREMNVLVQLITPNLTRGYTVV